MFRKKNYIEKFMEAFEHLPQAEKNQVIELAQQATALAEKHPNQPDPNKWGDMYDTILAIELSQSIKTIVFRR